MATTLRTVARSQVRFERKKFVLTAVSVALAAFFLTAIFLVNSVLSATVRSWVGLHYGKADLVVVAGGQVLPGADSVLPAELVEDLLEVEGAKAAWAVSENFALMSSLEKDGVKKNLMLNHQYVPEQSIFPFEVEGSYPSRENEVLISEQTAKTYGLQVGSTYSLDHHYAPAAERGEPGSLELTVSGFFKPSAQQGEASTWAFVKSSLLQEMLLQPSPDYTSFSNYSSLVFQAEGDRAQLSAAISDLLSASGVKATNQALLMTPDEAVEARIKRETDSSFSVYSLLYFFAAVALAVAAFVISNTFSVITGQRVRELGLLRTLGAQKPALVWMLLQEALLLGLLASAVGVVLAYLLLLALGYFYKFDPILTLLPGLGAILISTLLTLVMAFAPSLRAFKISPLQALNLSAEQEAGRPYSFFSLVLGFLCLLISGGIIYLALTQTTSMDTPYGILALGVLVLFILASLVLLYPLVFLPLVKLLARAFDRSLLGSIVRGNLLRSQSAALATGRSIFICTVLMAAALTGYASLKGTISNYVTGKNLVDLEISAAPFSDEQGLPTTDVLALYPSFQESLQAHEKVEAIAQVDPFGLLDPTGDNMLFVSSVDSQKLSEVSEHFKAQPLEKNQLAVDTHKTYLEEGQAITWKVGNSSQELVVRHAHIPSGGLISSETAEALRQAGYQKEPELTAHPVIWVRAASDMNPNERRAFLDEAKQLAEAHFENAGLTFVQGSLVSRTSLEDLLNMVLLIALLLLGIIALISLIGVANTLTLSAHQRRRDNALMRTLGLSARQLKQTVIREALVLALVSILLACLFGTALGLLCFRIFLVGADLLGHEIVWAVPWLGLTLLTLSGLALTWLVAYLPAAKIAKVPPVAALSRI